MSFHNKDAQNLQSDLGSALCHMLKLFLPVITASYLQYNHVDVFCFIVLD